MTTKTTITITISSNDENVIKSETKEAIDRVATLIKAGNTGGYESRNHDEGNDNYTEVSFDTITE